MKKNRLYTILGIACVMGYSWLFFALYQIRTGGNFSPCFFRNLTGYPCPACGSTRAIMLFFRGDIIGAALFNPVGIVLSIIMIVVPLGLAYDGILKKQIVFNSYKKTEQILRIKWVAAIAILLILANWIWNFYKPL
jgi:hypothetical protein